jgi:hypothetical protein|tara:strand:- start:179 stop:577 length:399 start_codon:yes stop_codon:yes gene_type:complete
MLSLVTTTRRKFAWEVTTVPYPRACSLTVLPAVDSAVESAVSVSEDDARVVTWTYPRRALTGRPGQRRVGWDCEGPVARDDDARATTCVRADVMPGVAAAVDMPFQERVTDAARCRNRVPALAAAPNMRRLK